MDMYLYISPTTWSRTQFCIECSFPNGNMLRTGMQDMKESEEDPIHEGTHILPQILYIY